MCSVSCISTAISDSRADLVTPGCLVGTCRPRLSLVSLESTSRVLSPTRSIRARRSGTVRSGSANSESRSRLTGIAPMYSCTVAASLPNIWVTSTAAVLASGLSGDHPTPSSPSCRTVSRTTALTASSRSMNSWTSVSIGPSVRAGTTYSGLPLGRVAAHRSGAWDGAIAFERRGAIRIGIGRGDLRVVGEGTRRSGGGALSRPKRPS